jgi:hypothetical protein
VIFEGEGGGPPQAATFRAGRGFQIVKTFLKVLLIIVGVLLVLKLLPLLFGLGVGLVILLTVAGLLGLGVTGILVSALVVLAVLLSPLWLPLLVIVGIIALVKKSRTPGVDGSVRG